MEYQNTQLYMECQLVAIWNAARWHGMENKVPKIGTKEYDRLAEKYHCINGSCLGAKKELKRFGLEMVEGKWNFNWIKDNLPVMLSVYPPDERPHAILAVECKWGGFEVVNMGGGVSQWYSYDKLASMQVNNIHFLPQAIRKKTPLFETILNKLRRRK